MIFRSRKDRSAETAVADHGNGTPQGLPEDFPSIEELLQEIDELERSNAERRDPAAERRILDLRHVAGAGLIWEAGESPDYPSPAFDRLPEVSGLPEFSIGELTPELLRAGMLTHGCVLIRGLTDPELAARLAEEIDLTLGEREAKAAGHPNGGEHYVQFEPQLGFGIIERPWIEEGGGALAVDSPKLMFEMLTTFDRVGLRDLIRGYLGEPVAVSAQKCTLRKADPSVSGAWHQDGSFMRAANAGEQAEGTSSTRAFNVWLSLSSCGEEAPGLDIVPRRLDHLVATRGEGTDIPSQVSDQIAREAAGDAGIIRPHFEPGDALLFDGLFLHQTGSDPAMSRPRFALESWFFGVSAFPEGYVPLAA
jgi:hypothetical protein